MNGFRLISPFKQKFILIILVICLLITNVNSENSSYPFFSDSCSFAKIENNIITSPLTASFPIILHPFNPAPEGQGYSCDCRVDPREEPPRPCIDSPKYTIFSSGSYLLGKDEKNGGSSILITGSGIDLDGNGDTTSGRLSIQDSSSNIIIKNFNCGNIKINSSNISFLNNLRMGIIDINGSNITISNTSEIGSLTINGSNIFILKNRILNSNNYALQNYGSNILINNNEFIDITGRALVNWGSNVTILNNKFNNLDYGIQTNGNDIIISENIMNEIGWHGISSHGNNISINNNYINITIHGGGIISWGSQIAIKKNIISANNSLLACEGINSFGSDVMIEENKVLDCNHRGINIHGNNTLIKYNIIKNSLYGSNISGLNVTLFGNNFTDNGYAIEIVNNWSNGSIYNNYFCNSYDYYSPFIPQFNWTNPSGPTPGTNIMGGPYIAGNYWGGPNSTGWSDLQPTNPNGYSLIPYEIENGTEVYDTAPLVRTGISPTPTPAKSYVITASASSGGKIEPSGEVFVTEGENQEFDFLPDDGYLINNVTVDDELVSNVSPYIFENVTADHKINVTFNGIPIVLVHGLWSDKHTFDTLISRLNYENITYYTFDYSSLPEKDPRTVALKLKSFIETEEVPTPFDIVCHSNGAIVTRYYMEMFWGSKNVRQWIGVCPAHHGSAFADLQDLYPRLYNSVIGPIINLFGKWKLTLDHLSTRNEIIYLLKENEKNGFPTSSNVKYRVIAGYNPSPGNTPFDLWSIWKGYTESKNDKNYYYWTNLGDGIVSIEQALLSNTDYDLLPYSHINMLKSNEAIDLIIRYYKNPSANSVYAILPILKANEKIEGDLTDIPQVTVSSSQNYKITNLFQIMKTKNIYVATIYGATAIFFIHYQKTHVIHENVNIKSNDVLNSDILEFSIITPSGKEIVINNSSTEFDYYSNDNETWLSYFGDEKGIYSLNIRPINPPEEGYSGNLSVIVYDEYIPTDFLNINSTSDEWSIIYPKGDKLYPIYSNQTFITQSKPGADLLDVIVDEQSKGANKSYTFTNITLDHSIQTVGDATPHQVHVMFNATPRTGKLPLRIEFIDESLGEPNTWYWQFGDGVASSDRNPIHTYTRPGIYTVSLRAYNNVSGGMGVMNEMIRVTG